MTSRERPAQNNGGLAEWSIATVLKTVERESVPRVRIPEPPPKLVLDYMEINSFMFKHYPLQTSNEFSKSVGFMPSDDSSLLMENKRYAPSFWRWHNESISYNMNSNGFRCQEFAEIDYKNSIALVGCSHVMGVGNKEEETITSYMQQLLDCPVINLGQSGADNEMIFFNSLWALQQGFKKVITVWSYPLRYNHFVTKDRLMTFQPHDAGNHKFYDMLFTKNFMNDIDHFETRCELYKEALKPYSNWIEISFVAERDWNWALVNDDTCNLKEELNIFHIDYSVNDEFTLNELFARDLLIKRNPEVIGYHYGRVWNKYFAKRIVDETA